MTGKKTDERKQKQRREAEMWGMGGQKGVGQERYSDNEEGRQELEEADKAIEQEEAVR